jgi:hypothetical protein
MREFPRDGYASLTKAVNDLRTLLREAKHRMEPGAYQDLYRAANVVSRAQTDLGVELRQAIAAETLGVEKR